jgi:hypothetical protein
MQFAEAFKLALQYDAQKNKDLVDEEIREMLRIRRKVKMEADDNFEIMSSNSIGAKIRVGCIGGSNGRSEPRSGKRYDAIF